MIGVKVLLVDEEQSHARELGTGLSQRNVHLSIVATPEDALAQLDREPFIDVALLALQKPGHQCIETLRRIKQNHPLVEVIILTGEDTVHTAIEGMKKGAFDLVTQPWDMDELVLKIDTAKQKKRNHQEKILRAANRELLKRRGS